MDAEVKKLKKLLTKAHLTGEDVGRLMIADLVVAYKNAHDGKPNTCLLSQDERMQAMQRMHGAAERRIYNEYVGIYELVKSYGSICQVMATSVELQFWRVYSVVNALLQAETNYGFSTYQPVIMTEKEYEEKQDSLSRYRGGVAVLQERHPYPKQKVDERGWFIREDARTRFLADNMAEVILKKYGETMEGALKSLVVAARVYFTHATSLELIGEAIRVPMTAPLVYPFPLEKIAILNSSMRNAHEVAERYEIEDPEERARHENALNARLREVFQPVDLEVLKPPEKLIAKVRENLSPERLRDIKLSEELSRR